MKLPFSNEEIEVEIRGHPRLPAESQVKPVCDPHFLDYSLKGQKYKLQTFLRTKSSWCLFLGLGYQVHTEPNV